jgi:hypothetical protein
MCQAAEIRPRPAEFSGGGINLPFLEHGHDLLAFEALPAVRVVSLAWFPNRLHLGGFCLPGGVPRALTDGLVRAKCLRHRFLHIPDFLLTFFQNLVALVLGAQVLN